MNGTDTGMVSTTIAALPLGTLSAAAVQNTVGFSGYRYEAITSLYHVRFREFDPFRGRWLQRDPAGYMDSNNLYGYIAGNPIGWIDPFGLTGHAPLNSADPLQFGSMLAHTILAAKDTANNDMNGDGSLRLIEEMIDEALPDSARPGRLSPDSNGDGASTVNNRNRTIPRMVFTSAKEDDRFMMPGCAQNLQTFDDLIRTIRDQLKAANASTVDELVIDNHNSAPGQALIALDLLISDHDATVIEEGEAGGWPSDYVDKAKEKQTKLKELTDLISDNGSLQLVQCYSGQGPKGAKLREFIADTSENRINIQTWLYGVQWFYGSPVATPWYDWLRGGKAKRKPNQKDVIID